MKKLISTLLIALILMTSVPMNHISAIDFNEEYMNDIINSIIDDEELWTSMSEYGSSAWFGSGYYGAGYLQFMDLNYDNKLEFIVTYPCGSMRNLSSQVFYCSNGNLIKAGGGDNSDLIDSYNSMELKYYYNPVQNRNIITGSNALVVDYANNVTGSFYLSFDGQDVFIDYYAAKMYHYNMNTNTSQNTYYDGASGYGDYSGANEISEEEYNYRISYLSNECVDLNKTAEKVLSTDWKNYSTTQKRNALIAAYKSFGYDEYQNNNQKSIAVFTTDKNLSIKTGNTMSLAFALMNNNDQSIDNTWSKMAITNSNPSVVLLSDYSNTEYGYYFDVYGIKQGNSNLTITDTETGINTIVTISVYDDYVKTYSYAINNIRSFYPDNFFEKNIKTNIYNLNGIYVNNYDCKEEQGVFRVSFDAYNSKYYYGAVDIYDADGKWLGFEQIDKYSDITSLWDTGERLFTMYNALTYKDTAYSKHTKINIEVPSGGYFTISNNTSESLGVFLMNALEIVFDSTFELASAASQGVDKVSAFDSFISCVKGIYEDPNTREELQIAFANTIASEVKDISKNLAKAELKDSINLSKEMNSELVDLLENFLGSFKIEWKHLFKTATGLSEKAFEKLSGPAGPALKACFGITKASNKLLMAIQMARSTNNTFATFYSKIDEGFINQHGVIVNTNGNVDAEAVLQVFRVSNDDIVRPLIENSFQKSELYNISFVKDDCSVQPNGKVKVQIPIPSEMKGNTCKVYRQESDDSWQIIDARKEGNYLVFETNHFSLYSIVGDLKELTISSFPKKMVYNSGDMVELEGIILDLGGELIYDGFICTPAKVYEAENQQITVHYGNLSVNFTISINSGDVYYIYTLDDLKNIRNDLAGEYVIMNDIDMSDVTDWEPIGDSIYYSQGYQEKENGKYFSGILNGNGHIIKNFHISLPEIDQYSSETVLEYGLFAHVSGARINNICFENVDYNLSSNTLNSELLISVLTASMKDSIVNDCSFSGRFISNDVSIKGATVADLSLGNCIVESVTNRIYGNINGIIGSAEEGVTKIYRCTNYGSLNGNGIAESGQFYIENCANMGSIENGSGIVGHLLAAEETTGLCHCYNYGDILFEVDSQYNGIFGGIARYIETENNTILNDCVNYGDLNYVELNSNKIDGAYMSISAVGGLFGSIDYLNASCLTNCRNHGQINVDVKQNYEGKPVIIGGVIGQNSMDSVEPKCNSLYNQGEIIIEGGKCSLTVGGIAGELCEDTVIVESLNMGDISICDIEYSEAAVISVAGVSCNIYDLEKVGNQGGIIVSGDVRNVICGGISSRLYSAENRHLENVYNAGDITIFDSHIGKNEYIRIGGLSALIMKDKEVTLNNFHNYGEISIIRSELTENDSVGYVYADKPKGATLYVSNSYVKYNNIGQTVGNGDKDVIESICYVDNYTNESSFSGFDFNYVWDLSNDTYPTIKILTNLQSSTCYRIGDVDMDNRITIVDATFIQRSVASIPIPFQLNEALADIDEDQIITIMDATSIQRGLANLKTGAAYGKPIIQ